MFIKRKTVFFALTLSLFLLLSASAAWPETVEYDGLIEPYEVVEIGARRRELSMK